MAEKLSCPLYWFSNLGQLILRLILPLHSPPQSQEPPILLIVARLNPLCQHSLTNTIAPQPSSWIAVWHSWQIIFCVGESLISNSNTGRSMARMLRQWLPFRSLAMILVRERVVTMETLMASASLLLQCLNKSKGK